VVCHDADYLFITFNSLVFFGVEYKGSMYINQYDGKWGMRRNEHGQTHDCLYMSRKISFSHDDATSAAKKTARTQILETVLANADALVLPCKEAHRNQLVQEQEKLEEENAKLTDQMNQNHDRIRAVANELRGM
jgi:hypothetical protein